MKRLLKPSTKKKISKFVKSAKRKTKRTLTKYHIRRPRKNPDEEEIKLLTKLFSIIENTYNNLFRELNSLKVEKLNITDPKVQNLISDSYIMVQELDKLAKQIYEIKFSNISLSLR